MNKFEEFKSRIDRKLNVVDAKLSYMNNGLKGLTKAFREFRTEMDDFIDFTADSYADHERMITILEKKQS